MRLLVRVRPSVRMTLMDIFMVFIIPNRCAECLNKVDDGQTTSDCGCVACSHIQ